MSLRRRLEQLEAGGGRCPACGGPWQPGDPVEYVVDWGDGDAPEPLPPCPGCGRERECIVDWDDLPDPLPWSDEGDSVPDYPPQTWRSIKAREGEGSR